MTPQRAVHVIGEVAKALDHAHRRHLLHRAMKNPPISSANDERIFLADFGIARALDEVVGLTQTGMIMASVAYASPESLTGNPPTTDPTSTLSGAPCTGCSPAVRRSRAPAEWPPRPRRT